MTEQQRHNQRKRKKTPRWNATTQIIKIKTEEEFNRHVWSTKYRNNRHDSAIRATNDISARYISAGHGSAKRARFYPRNNEVPDNFRRTIQRNEKKRKMCARQYCLQQSAVHIKASHFSYSSGTWPLKPYVSYRTFRTIAQYSIFCTPFDTFFPC